MWHKLSLGAVAIVGVGLSVATLWGQAPSGGDASAPLPEAVGERLKSFFRDISADRAREAYDELLDGSPLSKQAATVDKLVEKTPELQRLYGEARGFEQVSSRRIGEDVAVLKYLYKCESFPVVWHFTVYRTVDRAAASNDLGRWVVVSVRFDTDVEGLAR